MQDKTMNEPSRSTGNAPPAGTFKIPDPKRELVVSGLLGVGVALLLFVLMALAQMIGDVEPPVQEIDETLMAFAPPEIAELEDEPPPPPEEEEPPPELEEAPPELSLAQLDLALNPGTGGSLVGDFAMPMIQTSSSALGTEDFVDFSDLDQKPRPIGAQFKIPSRLKRKKVNGLIVLFLQLSETGEVLDVRIKKSDLPQFDDVVLAQVSSWRFTPPTQQGRPVKAQAELPFPITIN